MKRFIWLVLLLSACNTKPTNILTQDNLITQSFNINTKADTTITTLEGIQVTIPANAIAASTATVTLLIREALSLSDIIQAGLTTQSKDGILSSNGMFYINTKETSTILKPLQIKVPAEYADTAMRLYKGVTDKDRIQWQAPEQLNVSQTKIIQNGEALFNQSCKSCHDVKKKLVAPALANVENRWEDRKLLFKWIRNSFSVLQAGDPYAACLFCEYHGQAMPAYPAFTDNDIEGILAFINRETIRLNLKESGAKRTPGDSTRYYQRYYAQLVAQRASLAENRRIMTDIRPDDRNTAVQDDTIIMEDAGTLEDTAIREDTAILEDNATDMRTVLIPGFPAESYQLSISAWGWYNVDVLLYEKDAVKSRLAVSLKGDYSQVINMYLVIPAYKVFAAGGLLDNGTQYGFYDGNGTIYLPQAKDAYIIAVGEEKGSVFYGQQSFVTSADQTVEIKVSATTEADMKAALKKLALDKVDISAKKLEHTDDIGKIDAEIERVRKLGNICACMASAPVRVN